MSIIKTFLVAALLIATVAAVAPCKEKATEFEERITQLEEHLRGIIANSEFLFVCFLLVVVVVVVVVVVTCCSLVANTFSQTYSQHHRHHHHSHAPRPRSPHCLACLLMPRWSRWLPRPTW